MLTWLACGSQGTVPPPWELPPASLTPLDSLTSPETPSGGNPASCPKYAASVQRELEQLKAQLKAQREQYAQLQDETARLRSDASAYYRKEAAKQMLTCDCAQCQSGSPPPKPNPNQGSTPAARPSGAPPWSAPMQQVGAPAQPKTAPGKLATGPGQAAGKPASAPEPPMSAPGKAGASSSPARSSATASAAAAPSDCPDPTPRLPSGSHAILVVAEAPEDGSPEMGMANRMHRMADALVSIGVVVHVVLHADMRHPPTTLPGMRVYSGAMREQYTRALAAAGDELRLGVVFANMVTVRLRKRLGVLQKGLVQRAARNDRRGDVGLAEQLRVQARLADTSQARTRPRPRTRTRNLYP